MLQRGRLSRRRVNWRVGLGGGILLVLTVVAVFAPVFAPVDPLEQDLLLEFLPPLGSAGAEPGYIFGTDSLGRDVLSRLIFGTRIALIVALIAGTCTACLGTVLGLLAGFYGGWIDQVISRLVDVWMAFPPVLLSIVLVAFLGAGLHSVIIAIIVIDWTRFCRVVRAETLQQKKMEYVDSAVIIAMTPRAVLLKEILVNTLPLIATLLTLEMGIAIIVEAILSFVGLSVSSDTPSWGGMIAEGRQNMHQGWWVLVFPMGLLIITVLALNLFGDGIRNQCDPVLQR